ncbi:MAG: hypothetical protein IBX52_05370 [Bacterioplanes sp.]|nr:hypothetical protein [Bacterioplanes sp.]
MQVKAALGKTITVAVTAALLSVGNLANAQRIDDQPSAGAMVADAVFARPAYFALSQVGALVYAATLPFTLLGGNAEQAAETLVITPLQGAFVRCLGCGGMPNEVSRLREGDGKRIQHFVMLSGGYSEMEASNIANRDESSDGANLGLYLGSHFALSDRSRFDVMLGVKQLADFEAEATSGDFTDTVRSYQIVTRFGRELGGTDLMFKLGMHAWQTDREYRSGDAGDFAGYDFFYGIGWDFVKTDGVRFGIDYTRYGLEDSGNDYKANIDTYDLNFSVMF